MLDTPVTNATNPHISTAQNMCALGDLTNNISQHIPQNSKVGYVDYPMHINVGDLLIFLGAMNFFKWNNNSIPQSFCLYDARPKAIDALTEVDVIACHGGGNFGDIYPKHQNLRHKMITSFPKKPIVIMPQSFHFSSQEAMHQSARVFAAHENVTIYVRDEQSYKIARNHFSDKVFYSPDMAHRLYNDFAPVRYRIKAKPTPTPSDPFYLMRTDVEASPDLLASNIPSKDWKDIMRFTEKLRIERHRAATKISGNTNRPDPNILFAYHKTIRAVVQAIALRIGGLEPWTTSRLHGAIFGLLLDRTITLYDNSYGKNSRYFSKWAPGLVKLAKS